MQNFAIAGGVLNGDPEVWIEEAVASLSLQAAGDVMRGHMLAGDAQMAMQASLPLSLHARITGGASMSMAASGSLIRGATLAGDAVMQMGAAGDFTRWVMLEGLAPVEFYAEGDIKVVESVSATFSMELRATGDIRVARSHQLEGSATIELDAGLKAWSVPATPLSGRAVMEFASIGYGALRIMSPPGVATLELAAHGAARLGAKVPLEGSAVMGLYARGDLGKFRYVFLEGTATMELAAWAEKIGRPAFPDHYVEAPKIRTLRLTEETRRFTVPAERRL